MFPMCLASFSVMSEVTMSESAALISPLAAVSLNFSNPDAASGDMISLKCCCGLEHHTIHTYPKLILSRLLPLTQYMEVLLQG